jgi:hypothetical protein
VVVEQLDVDMVLQEVAAGPDGGRVNLSMVRWHGGREKMAASRRGGRWRWRRGR